MLCQITGPSGDSAVLDVQCRTGGPCEGQLRAVELPSEWRGIIGEKVKVRRAGWEWAVELGVCAYCTASYSGGVWTVRLEVYL
jgi:hypothetical protein